MHSGRKHSSTWSIVLSATVTVGSQYCIIGRSASSSAQTDIRTASIASSAPTSQHRPVSSAGGCGCNWHHASCFVRFHQRLQLPVQLAEQQSLRHSFRSVATLIIATRPVCFCPADPAQSIGCLPPAMAYLQRFKLSGLLWREHLPAARSALFQLRCSLRSAHRYELGRLQNPTTIRQTVWCVRPLSACVSLYCNLMPEAAPPANKTTKSHAHRHTVKRYRKLFTMTPRRR